MSKWSWLAIALLVGAAWAVATLGINAGAVKVTVIAVGFLVVWLMTKFGRRRQKDDEDSEPGKEIC